MFHPTATYWSYWGLAKAPFRVATASDVHLSSTHDEALARLHFLIEHGRRFGLLLGGPGTGKSLILSRFAYELRSQGLEAVFIRGYGLSSTGLLLEAGRGLGLDIHGDEPAHVIWAKFTDRLEERRYQRLLTVVLLDDVEQASPDALATLVRMIQADAAPESRVTVIAGVESENAPRLGARLLDLVDLRIELEPWSRAEIAEFVEQSLAKVGQTKPLFDPDALERIYELTGGRPRRISQLADLALIAAAGHQRPSIDAETVESVYRELSIGFRQ